METVQYDSGLAMAFLTLALTLERLDRDEEAAVLARRAETGADPKVIRAAELLAWRLSSDKETDVRSADGQ
jgi:hypothetical protein